MKVLWRIAFGVVGAIGLGVIALLAFDEGVRLGARLEWQLHQNTAERVGPEFKAGFEKGVRYGLLAYLDNETETDIPTLTNWAKAWYYVIEVKRGRFDIVAQATDRPEEIVNWFREEENAEHRTSNAEHRTGEGR